MAPFKSVVCSMFFPQFGVMFGALQSCHQKQAEKRRGENRNKSKALENQTAKPSLPFVCTNTLFPFLLSLEQIWENVTHPKDIFLISM